MELWTMTVPERCRGSSIEARVCALRKLWAGQDPQKSYEWKLLPGACETMPKMPFQAVSVDIDAH